jgi:hypothetical protein
MPNPTKVPVGARALSVRINRRISREGQSLRRCRSARERASLGNYYIVENDAVSKTHIELEQYAREIGVLSPHERLDSK